MVYIDADVVGYEAIVESYFLKEISLLLAHSTQARDTMKTGLLLAIRRIFAHMRKKKIT
jgi:hypothetical protein